VTLVEGIGTTDLSVHEFALYVGSGFFF